MNLEVKPATLEDIHFIVDAQIIMALETENLTLDRKTVTKGVQAVMEDPQKGQYWIAMEAEQALGCLLTLNEWSDWRNGNVLWIHSAYVCKEARGKGAFKALYLHLKNIVQQSQELKGLRLYVDKSNQNAINVYSKLGMTNEHYELFEWLKDY